MNLKNLNKILEKEPAFRKKQIKKLIFQNKIKDWDSATNLSLELRERLKKECPLDIKAKTITDRYTQKALIAFEDGLCVETVLMKHDSRNTVCLSSQIGCNLGCKFCATGQMGLKRKLDKYEILEQLLFFAREEKISNIVFMGMGEPFLNYDNVIEAIKIINSKDGFNIGARKISISTVGIIEGIKKLSDEKMQINLAISLHAPTNELRSKIMPVNKKYSIENILKAVDDYIKKTNRKVMFEYVLLKNINDSLKEAEELAKIMKKPLYMVNLIKYNDTEKFKAPNTEIIKKFKNYLLKKGINVTERYRLGGDIHAACGQLYYKNNL